MKTIQLTKGKFTIVDDEDFEMLSKLKWHTSGESSKSKTYYAINSTQKVNGKQIAIRMHRMLLNAPEGLTVDHINGDGLDNRKENLRLCTYAENKCNSKINARNITGFKGITWHKKNKKWLVAITFEGKRRHVGYFEDKNDAALAYNEAAKKYHGEFAKLNNL